MLNKKVRYLKTPTIPGVLRSVLFCPPNSLAHKIILAAASPLRFLEEKKKHFVSKATSHSLELELEVWGRRSHNF